MLKKIKKQGNYLNEIAKYLLCIENLRSKYTKLKVPFPIIIAVDDAYGKTKDWYRKIENDLEELKLIYKEIEIEIEIDK